MRYSDIRPTLKTGDCLLFSGKGRISELIKWASGSAASHIGVVAVVRDLDLVCIFESTTLSDVKDVFSGRQIRGVQVVPLSHRLARYDGNVWVRRLNQPLSSRLERLFWGFHREIEGREYEDDKLELIASLWGGWRIEGEDLSALFCSELVAELYERLGVLQDVADSNAYTPARFTSKAGTPLPFGQGWRLGPEVPIERDESEEAIG